MAKGVGNNARRGARRRGFAAQAESDLTQVGVGVGKGWGAWFCDDDALIGNMKIDADQAGQILHEVKQSHVVACVVEWDFPLQVGLPKPPKIDPTSKKKRKSRHRKKE